MPNAETIPISRERCQTSKLNKKGGLRRANLLHFVSDPESQI